MLKIPLYCCHLAYQCFHKIFQQESHCSLKICIDLVNLKYVNNLTTFLICK